MKTYPLLGGKASVTLFLDGRLVPSSLQRFEAAPGAVVPLHSHDDSDEIVFIVAGKGEMTVGGAAYAVETGDAIRLAQGRRHGLTVTEKLVAVLCYAPAGPEQRFKGAAPLPAKTETKP